MECGGHHRPILGLAELHRSLVRTTPLCFNPLIARFFMSAEEWTQNPFYWVAQLQSVKPTHHHP